MKGKIQNNCDGTVFGDESDVVFYTPTSNLGWLAQDFLNFVFIETKCPGITNGLLLIKVHNKRYGFTDQKTFNSQSLKFTISFSVRWIDVWVFHSGLKNNRKRLYVALDASIQLIDVAFLR